MSRDVSSVSGCFFFQAEDGIRDLTVTGVQTCALPIVKLFPDGHEEPIRNAGVSGVTAASFKDIVAASQSRTVYTSPFRSPGGMFAGLTGGGGMSFQMASAGLGYAASYVVPSLLFEDVTVKGPNGDLPKPPLSGPPWAGSSPR